MHPLLAHPLLPRLLVPLIALLLGTGVGATVNHHAATTEVAAGAGPTTTTMGTTPDGAPVVTTPGTPGTTAAPGAATTVVTGAVPPPPSPAVGPGETQPTPVGVYRYLVKYDEEGDETVDRVVVKAAPAAPGEQRQDVSSGLESSTHQMSWRRDGVVIRSTSYGDGQDGASCDWQPDIVLYRLPLAAGTTWTGSGGCSMSIDGDKATTSVQSRGKVVRAESTQIGGEAVQVWVIERVTTVRTEGTIEGERFVSTSEERATEHFSPRHGMAVRSTLVRTTTEQGGPPPEPGEPPDDPPGPEHEEHELISLHPAGK